MVKEIERAKYSLANVAHFVKRPKLVSEYAAMFEELYIFQDHYWLYKNIKPNTVFVDIGGWRGDTALYFAMHPNVKKLYAYEPLGYFHKEAKALIDRSIFKDKITLVKSAVTTDGMPLKLTYNKITESVESVPIESITKLGSRIAMKLDVEGAEEFLLNDFSFKNVYAAEIEYHNEKAKDAVISTMQKNKFKIELGKHSDFGTNSLSEDVTGYVYAKRTDKK